jgi:hypothetical protein
VFQRITEEKDSMEKLYHPSTYHLRKNVTVPPII